MSDEFRFANSREAEQAFYAAFEAADIEAMMAVWLDSAEAICIHPMSDRLVGRAAIEHSWRQIFSADGAMRFELSDAIVTAGTQVAVHCLYEDIAFGEEFAERSRILATNTYVRTEAGWRIQSHHGSPGTAVPRRAPAGGATMH